MREILHRTKTKGKHHHKHPGRATCNRICAPRPLNSELGQLDPICKRRSWRANHAMRRLGCLVGPALSSETTPCHRVSDIKQLFPSFWKPKADKCPIEGKEILKTRKN